MPNLWAISFPLRVAKDIIAQPSQSCKNHHYPTHVWQTYENIWQYLTISAISGNIWQYLKISAKSGIISVIFGKICCNMRQNAAISAISAINSNIWQYLAPISCNIWQYLGTQVQRVRSNLSTTPPALPISKICLCDIANKQYHTNRYCRSAISVCTTTDLPPLSSTLSAISVCAR